MEKAPDQRRPSNVTVPVRAHPFARLLYAEMRAQGLTYGEVEWRSGVLMSTFKSYRTDNSPGLNSIEAVLGAVGWTLVPVPRLDRLSQALRDQLEDVAQNFRSDEEAFGTAALMAATWPDYVEANRERLAKLAPGSQPALRKLAASAPPTELAA